MCPQRLLIYRSVVLLGSQHPVVLFEVEVSRLDMVEVFRCGEGLCRELVVVEEAMCQAKEVFEGKDRHNVAVEVFVLYRKAYHRNVVAVCSRGHDRHYFEEGVAHGGRCTPRFAHVVEVCDLAH